MARLRSPGRGDADHMLPSAFAGIAVLAVLGAILGFVNPVAGALVAIVAVAPLALMFTARLFRHTGPSSAAATRGPYVPSSSEASYRPAEDPRDRM